ncbi:MAG: carboxypeptidase regulatory-like domain-containing protein [Planctomycetota bacterium]|jgi:protocatechuate 3,4-dioxygenase beta subunit
MKRAPIILAVIVGIGLVAGLLWMNDSDSGRAGRRSGSVDSRGGAMSEGEGGASAASKTGIADAATIAKLIEKHGGFMAKGRLFLTRPTAAAVDTEVLLHTVFEGGGGLEGVRVEARAKSDAEGRFALIQLPRGADYTLQVEAERIQPFREVIPEPSGSEHDLGDLYLDRFYFLKGKVVSSSGVAVSGAEVATILPNGGGSFSWRSSAVNAGVADPVSSEATTGGDGMFTIKMRDPGIFTLRVRAEGWAPHYRGDIFVGAGGDTEVRISLTRGTEIGGLVLASDGRPLPGATVSIFANGRQWWSQVKEIRTTDDEGRFAARIEPQTNRYSVRVIPPDGVDVNKSFQLPLTEELVIQLPGGATIKGRVVDADTTQPIAGAEVLVGIRGPGARGWTPAYQKVLKTDSFGNYKLNGVGTLNVQSLAVSANGYAHFTGSGWTPSQTWSEISKIKLDSAAEITLPDVPLAPGRVVEGVVRDAVSGEPIAGAEITVNDMVVGNRSVASGSDGRYRVEDIGARVSLRARAEGYSDVSDNPWRGQELPADQRIVQRDFELQPAATIAGRVLTKSGAPVPQALVRLRAAETGRRAWMADLQLREFFTHTDSKGRYEINGAPPMKVKVEVRATGFDSAESEIKTLTSGDRVDGVDVKLVDSAVLGGMVVARGGGVVSGARVTIAKDPGEGADGGARWRMFADGIVTFTDEKGRFLAEDVPVGDIVIRIEAEGLATEQVSRKGVAPGEQITGMRITAKPALEISGKVLDEKGEPMSRAWVSARQTASPDGEPSTQQFGARMQGDGTFVVRNVPEGTYDLTVRVWGRGQNQPQYEPLERAGVSAGTKDIVFRLVVREE